MPTPPPAPEQQEDPLVPVEIEPVPEEPKPEDNYGNFDFLDNIAVKPKESPAPANDNILDFGMPDPDPQTQPEPLLTQNNFDLDLLGGNSQNPKVELTPPIQTSNMILWLDLDKKNQISYQMTRFG